MKPTDDETPGSDVFRGTAVDVSPAEAALIHEIADWAESLPKSLCRVSSLPQLNTALYLRPLHSDDILVRAFNWKRRNGREAQITLRRSQLEKHAPHTLSCIQQLPGWRTRYKNDFKGSDLSETLFKLLTKALEEAAKNKKA